VSIRPARAELDIKPKFTQPNQKSYLGAPNGEGGRTTPYKLIKKISSTQGVQLDLNLSPESWRLPHQIRSCLARYYFIMDSLGPDCPDKTKPMLWRTRFAASTHPHPPADGPSIAKVSARHCFGLNVTVCVELLLPLISGSKSSSDGRCFSWKCHNTVSHTLRELLQSHTCYP
jgi:hypothetical protein